MRKSAVKGPTVVILVLMLVLATLPVRAAPATQLMDLVVLIDNSGSMSANDPSGLRLKVPTLAAEQLTSEDRLGVLVFSLAVDPQLPLAAVPSPAEMEKVVSIGRAAGDTDLTAALEAAKKEFGQRGRLEARRAVIFVTDAIPDPRPSSKDDPQFMSSHLRALNSAAVSLAQDGCRLYGVCLGEPAELGLLEELCNQTGGSARHVTTERELATLLENIIQTEKEAAGDNVNPTGQDISLQVISPLSGEYPLENQLQLEVAIIGGGQRLTSGSFDKLPAVSCLLERAGEETVITLTDDGAGADVLADDGLFTGAVDLAEGGKYTLIFEAGGSYQGQELALKNRVENVYLLSAAELSQRELEDEGLFEAIKTRLLAVYLLVRPHLARLWILPVAVGCFLGYRRFRKRKGSPDPCLKNRLHRAAGYHIYYDETKNEPE